MSQNLNPFLRGYWNLRIVRSLCISYDDGSPLVWRSLHANQSHLSDGNLISSPCIVAEDFALLRIDSNDLDEALAGKSVQGEGVVGAVVYAIHGEAPDGRPVHIADTYSVEAAQEVIQRLTFETGYYSRCWEISTAHLTEATGRYLAELADIATPTAFLFLAFRLPYSPAIGIKLISTPWSDAHLRDVEDITAEQLRQEHRDKGLPDDLAEVLHLAAEADVRILIFDAEAPELDGLTIFQP